MLFIQYRVFPNTVVEIVHSYTAIGSLQDPLSSSLIASIILNEMKARVGTRERTIFEEGSE